MLPHTLTIPWLFCVYQLVTHNLGRTRRVKQALDDASAPKVVVVMPCYREEPDVLITALLAGPAAPVWRLDASWNISWPMSWRARVFTPPPVKEARGGPAVVCPDGLSSFNRPWYME